MKEKFVKVTWEDAKSSTDEPLKDVANKKISELTVIRETFGVLLKDEKDGVVVYHDRCLDDENHLEYNVIPRGIIKSVEVLKNGMSKVRK